jgi:hypothetical protein
MYEPLLQDNAAQIIYLAKKYRDASGIKWKELTTEMQGNYLRQIKPYPGFPLVTVKLFGILLMLNPTWKEI